MSQFSKVLIALSLALMPLAVLALEFKSVSVPKAVLYDAPSSSAKKILILSQYYPVEIIVNLGDWLKVRDAEGSINWVETKQLSDKRTVMITINQAEIRQAADASASLVATLEKGVLLEVVDTKPNNGWLKVRHRDGVAGFVLISSTWGFN
ncbi:MAG: SH3 domain-containing protein [Methylotenera sp.]|nr:SH3 domain-containing protein [Methylotenera sp.]MDO9389598.1 SH3 domain-containing protein [Methylotenera sp.]MDP2101032.1 SH3 domain-containing protein [Methylotenera sp.]MDP2280401.1 SH3 domain-containing protein [Methylotenera sp.]MDP2402660.1 SH3 domain-containing protein [Methylotenera sp.]